MRKKLLIFMLVLGLTSYLQADILPIELSVNGVYDGPGNVTEIEVDICSTVVIDVAAPEGLDYMAYLAIMGPFPGAGGEWGDDIGPWLEMCNGYYYEAEGYPTIRKDIGAGDISSVARYEYAGWGFGYEVGDNQSEGVNPGGTSHEFLYHCCGPYCEYVTIQLWNFNSDYVTPDDTIIIHQIPEPTTIALLGLGGLLLRRRK